MEGSRNYFAKLLSCFTLIHKNPYKKWKESASYFIVHTDAHLPGKTQRPYFT